jgi:hypothetical protein
MKAISRLDSFAIEGNLSPHQLMPRVFHTHHISVRFFLIFTILFFKAVFSQSLEETWGIFEFEFSKSKIKDVSGDIVKYSGTFDRIGSLKKEEYCLAAGLEPGFEHEGDPYYFKFEIGFNRVFGNLSYNYTGFETKQLHDREVSSLNEIKLNSFFAGIRLGAGGSVGVAHGLLRFGVNNQKYNTSAGEYEYWSVNFSAQARLRLTISIFGIGGEIGYDGYGGPIRSKNSKFNEGIGYWYHGYSLSVNLNKIYKFIASNSKTRTDTRPSVEKVYDTKPPQIKIFEPSVKRVDDREKMILVRGKIVDDSGIAEVLVNEIRVEFSSDGEFSTMVPLSYGSNKISIRAKDLEKNTSEKSVIVFRDFENEEKTSSDISKGESLRELAKKVREYANKTFDKNRSWAVVIGIKNYDIHTTGYDSLPYAVADAEAIKEYLVRYFGFQKEKVLTLYNERATKANIEKLLGDIIPRKVQKEDRILIFFSTHGDFIKTKGGNYGFLIPFDGNKKELYSTGISADQFSKLSDLIPAKHKLFLIDACFSGLAGCVYRKSPFPEETLKLATKYLQNDGSQIMTAGTSDQKALMSSKWGGHSLFTYYLLRGLKGEADSNRDQMITVPELYNYVYDNVPREAAQTPQLCPLSGEGQFVFFRTGDF